MSTMRMWLTRLTGGLAWTLPALALAQTPTIPSAPELDEATKAGIEKGGAGATKAAGEARGYADEAKAAGEQKVGEAKTRGQSNLEKVRAGVLNVNVATKEQLEALPGVGEKYAQKIVDARPFSKVEQLKNVLPKTVYKKIKSFVVAQGDAIPPPEAK